MVALSKDATTLSGEKYHFKIGNNGSKLHYFYTSTVIYAYMHKLAQLESNHEKQFANNSLQKDYNEQKQINKNTECKKPTEPENTIKQNTGKLSQDFETHQKIFYNIKKFHTK